MKYNVEVIAKAPVKCEIEVEAADEKEARQKALALALASFDPRNPHPPQVYWDICDSDGSGIEDHSMETGEVTNLSHEDLPEDYK